MFGYLGTGGQKRKVHLHSGLMANTVTFRAVLPACVTLLLPTVSSSYGTDCLALVDVFYPGSHWLGNAPELYSPARLI